MARSIGCIAHKGGSGCTTTVLNLGYTFARMGFATLLVDLDPQGGLLLSLNQEDRSRAGVAEIVAKKAALADVVLKTALERLHILGVGRLPANAAPAYEKAISQPEVLQRLLAAGANYEYILIDAPSGLSSVTQTVLRVVDSVLCVVPCDPLALRSLTQAEELLAAVGEGDVDPPDVIGWILTMSSHEDEARVIVAEQLVAILASRLLQSRIPYDPLFREALLKGLPVARLGGKARHLDQRFTDLAAEIFARSVPSVSEEESGKPLL